MRRLVAAVAAVLLLCLMWGSAEAAPSPKGKPPKPTPTPTPTATVTTTPTPTATATSTSSSGCALPEYPKPSCVGVPAGTTFSNTVNGDYDATQSGQIIDGWHITGDVLIKAPNVVIKNSQIDRSVFNRFGPGSDNQANTYSYTITDSTIGPASGCIRQAALQEANYVATRVLIRGVDHGVDVSEPGHMVLQDSFVTLCFLDATVTPPDGSHVDGIQTVCPTGACVDIRLSHNTMIDPTHKGTFIINLVDPNLEAPVLVEDTLMSAGDNYAIVTKWSGGDNWTIRNNRIVDGSWGSTSLSGAVSGENTCAHQTWTGNTTVTIDSNYHVTGTVAQLPCID